MCWYCRYRLCEEAIDLDLNLKFECAWIWKPWVVNSWPILGTSATLKKISFPFTTLTDHLLTYLSLIIYTHFHYTQRIRTYLPRRTPLRHFLLRSPRDSWPPFSFHFVFGSEFYIHTLVVSGTYSQISSKICIDRETDPRSRSQGASIKPKPEATSHEPTQTRILDWKLKRCTAYIACAHCSNISLC